MSTGDAISTRASPRRRDDASLAAPAQSLVDMARGAFRMVRIRKSAEELADYFLDEASVALVPGSVFGAFGEDYLRLSYANSYENLEQALENMSRAVKKLS